MAIAHQGLTELRVVNSMHERKQVMSDLSGGFIALPGGFGTLEEFFEIATWSQLGLVKKPCGIMNIEGYYDGLLSLLDHAVRERFVHPGHRAMILEETEPERMIDAISQHLPPSINKLLEPD